MALKQKQKRARSDQAKQDRQHQIEVAARQYFLESGYRAVTMSELARRAGLAKGTLYIYFRTKEEVFLRLYRIAMEHWVDRICSVLEQNASDEIVVAALVNESEEDPLFLPLLANLSTVLEVNVSEGALVEMKRAFITQAARLVEVFARRRAMDPEAARKTITALWLALQGVAQHNEAIPSEKGNLPDDVWALFQGSSFRSAYPDAARLILKGAAT